MTMGDSWATLETLANRLAGGAVSAQALLDAALARIDDPAGQGKPAFTKVHRAAARAAAVASDGLRAAGVVPSPLAGLPISIKDLFDLAGEPTPAGSVALADAPPAAADAPIVARLRAAGAVIVGRTNMTEFAFSGVGWNPHYGTPLNPWDRATGRIPGGSSSGAAVSVTDAMSAAAIGTDTGGSVRIPAALCGLAGFKPTARRVPRDGCLPLSVSLDSIGPLAPSVACCAVVDAVLAGETPAVPAALPVAGLRLLAPRNYVLDGMDGAVGRAYERALARLADAGARITAQRVEPLDALPEINAKGGLAAAEAFHWHRALLAAKAAVYDPRVRVRVERGGSMSAADYLEVLRGRAAFQAALGAAMAPFDAMVMPTTPIVAPTMAEIADDAGFGRANVLLLRNPTIANFLDGCALTVPCHEPNTAPVGLMLIGPALADRHILALGRGIEALLRPARG
jgi:aspartyl-tRNA(Asn)/glutamyl-tRNA(Gln) amidotransferase subunit A